MTRHIKWFRLIVIALLLYTGVVSVGLYQQYAAVSSQYEATSIMVQQLQREQEALKQEKKNLNNPAYIEKVAREELGLVKQGEVPYIRARQ